MFRGSLLPDRLRVSFFAVVLAVASLLGSAPSPAAAAGPAAGQKVAIIVGPTGSLTQQYRGYADEEKAAAEALGATVVTVYSPNATWANVKAAVNGANLVIYHGHGSGYPNPYGLTELTDRSNGWGLNETTNGGDVESGMVYCGEKALLGTLTSADGIDQRTYCGGGPITPAANFVMIYANACYTAGSSEPGRPVGDLGTARARVANFSYPVLKLGAGAYFATDLGATKLVNLVLGSPNTSYADIFRNGNGFDAGALRISDHPDLDGTQVWVQKTYSPWLGTDYWYAFAGNPNATPANSAIAPPAPLPDNVSRFGGADRYAVAAGLSAATFAPGVAVAYVATGATFPDALAGGVLAGRQGGPMLLVTRDVIPGATAAELGRLQPGRIVVLGGAGSVSDAVLAALDGYTPGPVTRLSGPDRYAVASAVSQAAFAPGVAVAYIATGQNFPDALAGVGPAAIQDGPILLVRGGVMPSVTDAELRRLQPQRIVVLGGPGSVGDSIFSSLAAYTAGSVTRLWGADRYGAALDISRGSFATAETIFVATGRNFPDALAGGPLAAITNGPLLLVPGTTLPDGFATEVQRLGASKAVILGGPASVSTDVQAQLESLLGR